MNTVKFNHLYSLEISNEITEIAWTKILEILDPVIRKEFTWEQANKFVSNGQLKYKVHPDFKIDVNSEASGLNFKAYAPNTYTGIAKDIGLEWMHATKGTFPKRLSSYLYKQYGVKLNSDILSQIGTIASAGNINKTLVYFDIFDCANEPFWKSGRYGDAGSCLWGGRHNALDIFKANKSMALRAYYVPQIQSAFERSGVETVEKWFSALTPDQKTEYGRGRAWMYYDEKLDAYIFWNGYDSKGEMQAIHYARLWATISGLTYHKLMYLANNGKQTSTVYINSGNGWIVHAMDNIKATNTNDYDFHFHEVEPTQLAYQCSDCEYASNDGGDFCYDHEGRIICNTCREENYRECAYTRDLYYYEETVYVEDNFGILYNGTRLPSCCNLNQEFVREGTVVYAEDTGVYIYAKHAYKDTNGFYFQNKPIKETETSI